MRCVDRQWESVSIWECRGPTELGHIVANLRRILCFFGFLSADRKIRKIAFIRVTRLADTFSERSAIVPLRLSCLGGGVTLSHALGAREPTYLDEEVMNQLRKMLTAALALAWAGAL